MIHNLILFIFLCVLLGCIVSSVIYLWLEGSIFSSINLFLTKHSIIKKTKAKLTLKRMVTNVFSKICLGLTCGYCLSWEVSLLFVYLFDVNLIELIPFLNYRIPN